MTRLPAPTLWPLSYRCSFPAVGHSTSGPKAGFSPSCPSTTSSVSKVPSPIRGPYPQTSDDNATSDVGLVDPSSRKKGRRSQGNRGSRSGESSDGSHSTRSTTSSGRRRKKRMDFLAKSRSQSLVGKRAIQVMSLMHLDSGLGASPITGTTMRTLT